MQYRKLGRNGPTVSAIGLGCMSIGIADIYTSSVKSDDDAVALINHALKLGITLLDTADIYGTTQSEEFLGRILEGRRDRIVLATKFGMSRGPTVTGGAAPPYVRKACDASLARLRTDRIDLYQLHTPDATVPIAETLGVLDELVREGKVREIGCSNLDAAQLREADEVARASGGARFVCVQNELSLLERADLGEGLAEAERLGLAYLPYFPLGSGLLTGKYHRGEPPAAGTRLAGWYDEAERAEAMSDAVFDRVEALARFAEERGHTLLDLAFAWLLAQGPVASVIAGATKAEQIAANAAAGSTGWRLSDVDLAALPA